jgi:hypothetical protein
MGYYNTDSSTQRLDFPLTATNGITGREREREIEREKPAHNKDTKSAKVERLCSARLIRRDSKAAKLDMKRLQIRQGLKPTSNYYYTLLSMIISQVKLINNKCTLATYAKHARYLNQHLLVIINLQLPSSHN